MLDITKLGFEDVVNQLIARLKEKERWRDVPITSTARTLIELYAYVMQLVMYYLKRTAEENFVDTAQFWSSLCRIANMLNLYVKRPQGAYGKIRIKVKSSVGVDAVQYNKYQQITIGDKLCYLCESVTVDKNNWKEVLVRQGERRTTTFNVVRNDWQEFLISNENASDVDIVVSAGLSQYEVVNDLFEGVSSNRARVYTKPDRSLAIQLFNAYGIPPIGSSITIAYSVVDSSWMPAVSDIVEIDNNVDAVLVADSWVSGSGYESIEDFRQRLIDMYRTGKRLVTKADFEKVFLSMNEVEKVKVLDVKDEFKAPFRGVKVYVKLKDRWDLPDAFLQKVEDEVIGKIGIQGVKVDVFPVNKVDVDVYVIVNRKVGMSSLDMETEIGNHLFDVYNKFGIGEWLNILRLRQEVMSLGYSYVVVVLPDRDLELKENQLLNLRNVRIEIVQR